MVTRWKTWRGARRLRRMIDTWERTMCPGLPAGRVDDPGTHA